MLTSRYIATGYSNTRGAFVFDIDTSVTGVGTISATNQFLLPAFTNAQGAERYSIVASRGSNIVNFGVLQGTQTLTFPEVGVWELRLTPVSPNPFRRIFFNNANDRRKITNIKQWGNVAWSSFQNAFWGCNNLNVTATDAPNLTSVSIVNNMFTNCTSLVGNSSFNSWQTGAFTSTQSMFAGCSGFNQNLSNWNLLNLTGANFMFNNATIFNNNLANWNMPNLVFAFQMFAGCTSFNQDVSNFTMLNVSDAFQMFAVTALNRNLANWQLRLAGVNLQGIFAATSMNTANYTDTIVGWANYVFANGAPINVNSTQMTGRVYTTSRSGGANFANAGAARTYLTTTAGWTISGDTVI